LPTSLTYIIASTRGCAPRGPDAVIGTDRSVNKLLPQFLKGRRKRTGHSKLNVFFLLASPFLWVNHFQGAQQLNRKENSSQGFHRHHRDRLCYHILPTSWFRNINLIPFDRSANIATFPKEFPHLLGPTKPCTNAVHMEPFPTSGFKVHI